ncbi:multidrug transporter MatE [Allostella vacuolata]|nr:multidrug transporter MatE [Stella vacuolata]
MQSAVAKWGNSLALRLPRGLAEDAGLVEGVAVDIAIEGDRVVISRARPKYNLDELLAQLEPRHRHAETDWGDVVGRERA